MKSQMENRPFKIDRLEVEVFSSKEAAAQTASDAAAAYLRQLSLQRETIGVIFATGASQLAMLDTLVQRTDLPWEKIIGLHLDEYVGISPTHPGSFRHYLDSHLTSRVPLKAFHRIDGNAPDLEAFCTNYTRLLHETDPQLCLMGIGENGHLAFNDPGVADFDDPQDVKVVTLDRACREQQAAEGWFSSLDAVPHQAITLTLPAILRVPRLLVSVPGKRKSAIVRRALEEPVSTSCPATILRKQAGATLYLDPESAADWEQSRIGATASAGTHNS